jgi:integrase
MPGFKRSVAGTTVTPELTNHSQNEWLSSNNTNGRHRIYPVTEGVQSVQTADVYERYFNHFLDHIKIHDLQLLLDFSPKVIKQMLIDYILYLRDEKPGKKLAKSTIKVHLSAILYFFQINNDDFNLTLRNFRIHLPSDEVTIAKDDDRPYNPEEIDKVLRDCNDLRSKVAVLLLCSTGMRVGSIPLLRMEDLTKIEYHKSILYKVQVYARTRDKYLAG